jgi:hypothetical protein
VNRVFGFMGTQLAFKQMPTLFNRAIEESLTDCALLVEKNAVVGIEQTASWMTEDWEAKDLKPETVEQKRRLGYKAKADRPLWRSSAMVQSIHVEERRAMRLIGPSQEYAMYHEHGRGRMHRPFMQPSLEHSKSEFVSMFTQHLRQIKHLRS